MSETESARPARAPLLLVSGMAVFGTATPVSAIVGRGFPTFLAAALRMATAAAVLLPLAATLARREGETMLGRVSAVGREDLPWLAAVSIVGTFLFSVFMVLGMREVPGSVGAVVMATTPAVTAVGAVLLFDEALTRVRILALGLGVAGVVVVNLSSTGGGEAGNALLGTALVFAAVCCEGVYTLSGKRLSVDLDPVTLTALAATLALLAFLPVAVWDAVGADLSPTAGQWAGILWWGVGTMGLGSVLWFAGVRLVEGSVAAVYMAVMPVSALVGSYLLLGESFDPFDVVGLGAVLAGMVLVHREDA